MLEYQVWQHCRLSKEARDTTDPVWPIHSSHLACKELFQMAAVDHVCRRRSKRVLDIIQYSIRLGADVIKWYWPDMQALFGKALTQYPVILLLRWRIRYHLLQSEAETFEFFWKSIEHWKSLWVYAFSRLTRWDGPVFFHANHCSGRANLSNI